LLVLEIRNALPKWKYIVNTITRLATCKRIRDELLKQQPLLLSECVTAATSQEARPNDIKTAVVLLRHPLPEDIALPSVAQDLLCRLFQQAAAAPKKDTLGAVYTLLAGACRPLPRILSSDVLRRFEQYVFGILREATDVDNPMILLYCLAIMRVLAESFSEVRETASQRRTSSSPTSQTWKPDSMRSFFEGVKAHKALQLIVLRVVWACKAGMDAPAEAYECIRFANIILAGIREEIRTEWCFNNPAIERKIHEKCTIQDMPTAFRFQAITFVNVLSSRSAASNHLFLQFQQYLISPEKLRISLNDFEECLGWTHGMLESSLDEVTCVKIIHCVLAQCLGQHEASIIHQHMSKVVLDRLCEATAFSSNVRQAVLRTATEDSESRMVRRLLTIPKDQSAATVHDTRYQLRMSLSKACCSLFLRAGLSAGSDEIRLSSDLVSILLQNHARADTELPCQHDNHRQLVNRLAFGMMSPTKSNNEPLSTDDWRAYLESVLHRNGDNQVKAVMSAVADICQTLEDHAMVSKNL